MAVAQRQRGRKPCRLSKPRNVVQHVCPCWLMDLVCESQGYRCAGLLQLIFISDPVHFSFSFGLLSFGFGLEWRSHIPQGQP